jgi:hypothetical protein
LSIERLASQRQPNSQFNSMHCPLQFSPSRIQLNRTPRQALLGSNANAHRTGTTEVAVVQLPSPQVAPRESWATSPRSPRDLRLHVSLASHECQSSLHRHQLPRCADAIQEFCIQLNCCQVSATSSKRQPHGQAIMHTYHDRHVVATRPGPSLHLPMPSDQEVRRDVLAVSPVQRSSVDFINIQP